MKEKEIGVGTNRSAQRRDLKSRTEQRRIKLKQAMSCYRGKTRGCIKMLSVVLNQWNDGNKLTKSIKFFRGSIENMLGNNIKVTMGELFTVKGLASDATSDRWVVFTTSDTSEMGNVYPGKKTESSLCPVSKITQQCIL